MWQRYRTIRTWQPSEERIHQRDAHVSSETKRLLACDNGVVWNSKIFPFVSQPHETAAFDCDQRWYGDWFQTVLSSSFQSNCTVFCPERLQEHLGGIKPSDSSDKPLMSMIIRTLSPVFARRFAVYTAVIVPLRCSKVAEARGQLQGGPSAPPRSQGAARGLFASTALRRNRPLLQELTWTDWWG